MYHDGATVEFLTASLPAPVATEERRGRSPGEGGSSWVTIRFTRGTGHEMLIKGLLGGVR